MKKYLVFGWDRYGHTGPKGGIHDLKHIVDTELEMYQKAVALMRSGDNVQFAVATFGEDGKFQIEELITSE